MENCSKTLFIGMPAYNNEIYIKVAIESLIKQTYDDWVLYISDNNSLDTTYDVCTNFAKTDKRIVCFKQDHNIGLNDNFNFVYDVFNKDYQRRYFMWAQSDDIWEPTYLETSINLLKTNKEIGVSFTGMDSIDSFSAGIRQYPSFKRFSSNSRIKNQLRYLLEPELLGKCNIFLGVYKKDIIDTIMLKTRYTVMYSDYVISFGILSHSHIAVSDKILYHKRTERFDDEKGKPNPIIIMSLRNGVFSLWKLIPLHLFYTKHVNNILKKIGILLIMLLRIPRSLMVTVAKYLNYFRHINKHKIKRKLFHYYAILFLKPYNYEKIRRERIDIGYGYATVSSKVVVNINQLYVNINKNSSKEKITIFESPHYSHISDYLKNKNTNHTTTIPNYLNYKKEYFPELNIKEQISSFEELARCIETEYEQHTMDVFVLVNKNFSIFKKQYSATVVDGNHRLSILAAIGVEKVICKIVDKIEEYND